MDLCNNGHNEIVYDGRDCPLCSIIEELLEAEKDKDAAGLALSELEEEYDELVYKVREHSPELLI